MKSYINNKKLCCGCKEYKEKSFFYINKKSSDGLLAKCKVCETLRKKEKCKKFHKNKILFDILDKNEKICSECGFVKKKNLFPRKYGLCSICRECTNVNMREYYSLHPEIISKSRKKYKMMNTSKCMLNNVKNRSKKYNINFNLSEIDIIIPKYCPIFNDIELIPGNGMPYFGSPSVDRINPSLGYIKNNIIVISYKANEIKNNASLNDMNLVYHNYFNKTDKKDGIIIPIKKQNIIIASAKCRAKKKNMEVSIKQKDLIFPEYCPILGIKLSYTNNTSLCNSPSLDRIDNTKGYTISNIRIISQRANTLKSVSTYEEYKKLYEFYLKLNREVPLT